MNSSQQELQMYIGNCIDFPEMFWMILVFSPLFNEGICKILPFAKKTDSNIIHSCVKSSCVSCSMLLMSLDYIFLIVTSAFSNIYFIQRFFFSFWIREKKEFPNTREKYSVSRIHLHPFLPIYYKILHILWREEKFEDNKGVIRIRK